MDRILARSAPAIVLLGIGTNDVLQQVPMSDRMRNLERIVAKLRQKTPNVRILLARISPTADTFRNTNSGLVEYNERVLAYAKGATTLASPIVVVDLYTGWSAAQFTQADGIHPNSEGESLLAERWANALVGRTALLPVVTVASGVTAVLTRRPVVDGAWQVANRLPQTGVGADVTTGSGVAGSRTGAPSGAVVTVSTGSTAAGGTVGIGNGRASSGTVGSGPGVRVTLTTPVGPPRASPSAPGRWPRRRSSRGSGRSTSSRRPRGCRP